MTLETSVSSIPFVGPLYAGRLLKLGIATVSDFLHHYPFRYDDFSHISPISSVQAGETVTVQGKVMSFSNQYTRRAMTIQKAAIEDATGVIDVTWFNQPFLQKTLPQGVFVSISGVADYFRGKSVFTSPEYEVLKRDPHIFSNLNAQHTTNETIHTGRLVPIYPETYGVSSKWLRSRIVYLLKNVAKIDDYLPDYIIDQYRLSSLQDAFFTIHFPNSAEEAKKAKYRLAFDEVFLVQLSSQIRKKEWKSQNTNSTLKMPGKYIDEFTKTLPFTITRAQQNALGDIKIDIASHKPMNRLLQGDVGSGKTVVAAAIMYAFYKEGFKSVLMAPTEILASQHFETIQKLVSPFSIPVALITGSTKKITGNEPIIIGTHALLYTEKIKNVGFVVIDEQHRFGVEQRTKFSEMGISPHLLAMTATPIPRSIALVLYSELDVSYIDQMPIGRIPIKTWYINKEKREKAYEWIKKELKSHTSQAFIVCPFIEESLNETMASVKAVKKEYETLQKIFAKFSIGLLHGKLASKEKKKVLDAFSKKEIDILLSTPVVEVGIDIPNATIMVIEGGERFGLAQLHQLRGRVGRGDKQSYCLIFSESDSQKSISRLKSLETLSNGSELAELDLKLRGPGQIYGTRQHGYETFKLASFSDSSLFKICKQAATLVLEKDEVQRNKKLQKKLRSYTIQTISPN
jgi:ATP-dependent DNA helicase RecG